MVGDAALDMVTEFRDELTILEGRVLAKPSMSAVRHLHSLSAQLLLLKSTISPLQSLIQSLRYADEVKASSAARPQTTTPGNGNGNGKLRHVGFISHEAKVYLSDTLDHIDSVVSSLDLFSGISENLIGELPSAISVGESLRLLITMFGLGSVYFQYSFILFNDVYAGLVGTFGHFPPAHVPIRVLWNEF